MASPRGVPAVLALLALTLPAVAAEPCTPTTSPGERSAVLEVSGQYFVVDLCQPDCTFSFWRYAESNGIDGLQRDDDFHDDTCNGLIRSDTILI